MNASDACSASILRLQLHSPFWGTLALFAERKITEAVPTAATDGRKLYFNPRFVESLTPRELDGLVVHELLHAALLHALRRKGRQPDRWNVAADYVVNAMIKSEAHLDLPEGGLYNPDYAERDVEEVYEMLGSADDQEEQKSMGAIGPDLLDGPPKGEEESSPKGREKSPDGEKSEEEGEEENNVPARDSTPSPQDDPENEIQSSNGPSEEDGEDSQEAKKTDANVSEDAEEKINVGKKALPTSVKQSYDDLKAHWENALRQSVIIQQMEGKGDLPAGIACIVEDLGKPQLDWRTLLWRYLARTPTDYGEFDRRHMHSGLYLEGMEGERLKVFVCIDTSGSISDHSLRNFLSEVRGILSGYAHVEVDLYYCDVQLNGPHELNSVTDEMPNPIGRGGTEFRPFFEAIADENDPFGQSVAVYLTDGYGTFPDEPPPMDLLWVVVPGGLNDEAFPFGTVVRMLD